MSLSRCAACTGFVPRHASSCPHCDTPAIQRSPVRRLLELAGGGAVALTLSACYGMAPRDIPIERPSTTACDPIRDVDGDGYCDDDCDQASAEIHPGANDPPGDALDQDCDGSDGTASDAVMAAPATDAP